MRVFCGEFCPAESCICTWTTAFCQLGSRNLSRPDGHNFMLLQLRLLAVGTAQPGIQNLERRIKCRRKVFIPSAASYLRRKRAGRQLTAFPFRDSYR
jgi:hypothetical protein